MTTTIVKSFRGISLRLAKRYLEGLGGTVTADGVVAGEEWTAKLSESSVTVGPTLTITEVTIHFEGAESELRPLIDAFSQKAMRAGG